MYKNLKKKQTKIFYRPIIEYFEEAIFGDITSFSILVWVSTGFVHLDYLHFSHSLCQILSISDWMGSICELPSSLPTIILQGLNLLFDLSQSHPDFVLAVCFELMSCCKVNLWGLRLCACWGTFSTRTGCCHQHALPQSWYTSQSMSSTWPFWSSLGIAISVMVTSLTKPLYTQQNLCRNLHTQLCNYKIQLELKSQMHSGNNFNYSASLCKTNSIQTGLDSYFTNSIILCSPMQYQFCWFSLLKSRTLLMRFWQL